jgi:hypothetical protein
MAKLNLKEEFKGKVLVRIIPLIGEVTFNTEKVKEYEYENYSKMGFSDCFESSNDKINERIEKINAQAEEVKEEVQEGNEEFELNLDLEEEEEVQPAKPTKKGKK